MKILKKLIENGRKVNTAPFLDSRSLFNFFSSSFPCYLSICFLYLFPSFPTSIFAFSFCIFISFACFFLFPLSPLLLLFSSSFYSFLPYKRFSPHWAYLPLSFVLPNHPLSVSGTHAELTREFSLQGSNRRHKHQETTPVVQDTHSPLVRVYARVIILSMKTC